MRFKSVFNNRGNVIVMVVIIFAVLVLLGTSSLYLISQQNNIVSVQNQGEDALYYAEAGYNQYLYYLNQDANYYNQTASDTFLASDHAYRDGYYHLQVIKPTLTNPEVTVQSTGWSAQHPTIKRTIEVAIYKRQFCQSVSLMGAMLSKAGGAIQWGDGENIHGPFHTNGDLNTSGSPTFWDKVSYVGSYKPTGSTNPIFKLTGQPARTTALIFPSTNTQLSKWGDPTYGGLTYTGRTCICLTGTTMKIRNESLNSDGLTTGVPIPSSNVIYIKTSGTKVGNLIISGQLNGKLTIVADGSIYIVGNDPTNYTFSAATSTGGLTYADQNIPVTTDSKDINGVTITPTDDLLGLVASGNIWIMTRGWAPTVQQESNTSGTNCAVANIKVQAVLFGLGDTSTFGVLSYNNIGNKGLLNLQGAVITSRRDATYATSGSDYNGYKENNYFDYRLLYLTPPHFLEPTNAGWEVRKWKEIPNPN
jgi:hypothetical protein